MKQFFIMTAALFVISCNQEKRKCNTSKSQPHDEEKGNERVIGGSGTQLN